MQMLSLTLAVIVLTFLCTHEASSTQTPLRSHYSLQNHRHRYAPAKTHSSQASLRIRTHGGHEKKTKTMIDSADEAEDVVDYIVVGGGTAGLAIARRLSDDPSVRVLVIEAGQSGEGAQKQIRQPNSIDYNALQSSELDWHYETAKQDNLNGRQLDFPVFKTLGGTSAGNDLIYLRQGRREAGAMAMLAKKMGGLASWSWERIDGAMNSSVTYQAVAKNETSNSAAIAAGSITGKGPIMLTYPNASLAVEEIWFPALQEVRYTPLSHSPWQGDQVGGIIAPITVEKGTSLRSYSRSAYLDSVCDKRHNLQVLTTATVTRILFEDKASEHDHLRALGVECASSKGSRRNIITAKREVIVSAGVIGSPQLLQVSGIGPRPVLEERGIAVKKELSGVGQHLQDSLLVSLQFHVKKGVKLPSSKSVPGYADSALAILSLKEVLHTDAAAEDFITRADKLSTKYYNHNDTDGSVKLACLKTGSIQLHQLLTQNATTGLSGQPKAAVLVKMKTANDLITFTISLQSPLSRGNVNIASSNPFDAPRIDPAYLSHPSDEELLIAGIEWARTLSSTKTFKKFLAKETSATSSVHGRKAWAKWFQEGAPGPNQPIKGSPVVPLRAGYQASSTNSLLAEEDGGVVGADFKVHGCSNLRIVDASVLPLAPSASLGAYVFGIAEMAASMIHADRKCGKAEPIAECQYGEEDDDDGEEAEHPSSKSGAPKTFDPVHDKPVELYSSPVVKETKHVTVAKHESKPATVKTPTATAEENEEECEEEDQTEEEKEEEKEAEKKKKEEEAEKKKAEEQQEQEEAEVEDCTEDDDEKKKLTQEAEAEKKKAHAKHHGHQHHEKHHTSGHHEHKEHHSSASKSVDEPAKPIREPAPAFKDQQQAGTQIKNGSQTPAKHHHAGERRPLPIAESRGKVAAAGVEETEIKRLGEQRSGAITLP